MQRFDNYFTNAKRYARRYRDREIFAWYKLFRYYIVFIPFVIVGLIALVIYVKPVGPREAYLAIGQSGSSYGVMADKFKSAFLSFGLDLSLVETTGLSEGLKALDDPKSTVNASFITAGNATSTEYPHLASLGSVQYAPIWLFYKGPTISPDDPFEYFANKKISIGLPNAMSNQLFKKFLHANNKRESVNEHFIELSHLDSVKGLKDGSLEAVFIVDSYGAPVVQSLIADPDVKIMSFNLADAYIRKFPFLHKLTIPKGSLNLEKVLPSNELVLVSTTTNLLIEKKTHPVIQWAFMIAASDVGKSSEDFFSKPGTFPKYVDLSFPLSPIAKRYYDTGVPSVFQYFPIWLGSLFDDLWVIVLAFIAIIYPLYKWIMGMRSYPSKFFLQNQFGKLRDLGEDVARVHTKKEAEELLVKLERLNELNSAIWLSPTEARFYFTLKSNTQSLKKSLEEKIASYEKKEV